LARREDDQLLRGRGRFIADVSLNAQTHLVFVRSPYANARIRSVDATAALEASGAVAVLTREDFPDDPLPPFLWDTPPPKLVEAVEPYLRPCHQPLLPETALYAGQAVAVVVAESRYLAEDAAELIAIDYEPLDPVPGIDEALASEAPVIHEGWEDNVAVRVEVAAGGDVDAALVEAAVVVRENFSIQRQACIPIETRGAVATYEDGFLTLWSSTQNAHPLRRAVSRVSGLLQESIRVIAPDVGGGFGSKGVLYPEDVIVALTAMKLGRPVKWVEDRLEHMMAAVHAREQIHEIELGVDSGGRILALRDHFRVDTGAYNPLGLVIPYNTMAHLMGPYRVPSFAASAECVLTTKVPTAPYRGAGRPEAVFAVERALDRAARELDLDPVELRLRNAVSPAEMPYQTGIVYRDGEPLVLDGGRFGEMLRRAAELVDWEAAATETQEGRLIGRGVAYYTEGTGIGPFESARVTVAADGRVLVRSGSCAQGQGHRTVFAQICADELGVDPEIVDVIGGDTEGLERGWGTVASRSIVVGGNAVAEAARAVRARLDELGLDLAAAARRAEEDGEPLEATSFYEPPTVTWASGAHAVVVAVDPETGVVEILRYAAVHDCGREVNPLIVDGQVRGGIAQGIGSALFEEIHYNEDGQLLNGTLADYLIPTATDIPPVALEAFETPSPLNPLGVRGVGEGGTIAPPAAIANAVEDAIAGTSDAVITRTPLAPGYVLDLLEGTPVSGGRIHAA
jgi:carbon-monoxide dehydrogenase large subunit